MFCWEDEMANILFRANKSFILLSFPLLIILYQKEIPLRMNNCAFENKLLLFFLLKDEIYFVRNYNKEADNERFL
jgi:hypothetical protein